MKCLVVSLALVGLLSGCGTGNTQYAPSASVKAVATSQQPVMATFLVAGQGYDVNTGLLNGTGTVQLALYGGASETIALKKVDSLDANGVCKFQYTPDSPTQGLASYNCLNSSGGDNFNLTRRGDIVTVEYQRAGPGIQGENYTTAPMIELARYVVPAGAEFIVNSVYMPATGGGGCGGG